MVVPRRPLVAAVDRQRGRDGRHPMHHGRDLGDLGHAVSPVMGSEVTATVAALELGRVGAPAGGRELEPVIDRRSAVPGRRTA
jgi:hypothetical protein